MRISYDHDIDAFMEGARGALLERVMGETGLCWDGDSGAFCIDTVPERLPDAIFRFGQGITSVYNLTLLSRSNIGSSFYDDLATMLISYVDESRLQRDIEPDVPNAAAYRVDYCIHGKSDTPIFLFGLPNRDKVRLTTIMLAHFHRHALRFESILVFENQTVIPRLDLARLSDVGGEMISSLESHGDLQRKLLQRVAA